MAKTIAKAPAKAEAPAQPSAPAPAPAQPVAQPATTTEPNRAAERAKRARAAAEQVKAKPKEDARTRYTLAQGEHWHEIGEEGSQGFVGITVTESGVESVIEISGQNRVKRGVSVYAITILQDAEVL